MMVNAIVPCLDRQVFGLGIPETIGCRERMWLVNHSEAVIHWQIDGARGSVSTAWLREGCIRYTLQLRPREDCVDVIMEIENQSARSWHDVFAFNCVSPAKAPEFLDPSLTRTYLSLGGRAVALADVPRVHGARAGISVYRTQAHARRLPPFARAFDATSPVISDGSWIAVLAKSGDAYMVTVTSEASFLFSNMKFGCIHAAPSFEDIAPHHRTVVASRVYFARGDLARFLARLV